MNLLTTYLADRDTPCPGCGYNLRGLTGERCPECSQELTIELRLAEPRQGAFVLAIVALAIGAGSAGVWLVIMSVLSLRFGDWPPAAFTVIPVLTILTEGGALLLLARRRGRVWFRSLVPGARTTAVTACFGLTFGAVLMFLVAALAEFD